MNTDGFIPELPKAEPGAAWKRIFQSKGFPGKGVLWVQCVREVHSMVNLLVGSIVKLLVDSLVNLLVESGESPKKTTQVALSILLQMTTPACQGDSLSHMLKKAFGEVSLLYAILVEFSCSELI